MVKFEFSKETKIWNYIFISAFLALQWTCSKAPWGPLSIWNARTTICCTTSIKIQLKGVPLIKSSYYVTPNSLYYLKIALRKSVYAFRKYNVGNFFWIILLVVLQTNPEIIPSNCDSRRSAIYQGLLEFIWTQECSSRSSNPGPALAILTLWYK